MRGFGAKNTGRISGLCLSTGFYLEPDTTDRSSIGNKKGETLNEWIFQATYGSHN
jgi:hypothetical protein